MGVLDDAIREHLELRRSHGADEAELRKQEDEALGPARREAPEAADENGDAAPDEAPAAVEEETAAEPALQEPEAVEPEPVASEPEPAPLVDEPDPDEVPLEESLATPTNAPEGAPPLEAPPEDLEEPTRVAPPEPADEDEEVVVDAEVVEDDEDVLEETPDFLQETPEHDRLWFEQKPPRDFDFDE